MDEQPQPASLVIKVDIENITFSLISIYSGTLSETVVIAAGNSGKEVAGGGDRWVRSAVRWRRSNGPSSTFLGVALPCLHVGTIERNDY
nr:hypothetical protein Iba_chr04aCG12800 [Ipomoea batatas]